MIKKSKDKYEVYDDEGKKKFGSYKTKKEADERVREMEMFKHMKNKKKK